MAGIPEQPAQASESILREVTLVLDRSGSMAGPKLDQVKAAALQVIEGLTRYIIIGTGRYYLVQKKMHSG